jgi:hypothetical protein
MVSTRNFPRITQGFMSSENKAVFICKCSPSREGSQQPTSSNDCLSVLAMGKDLHRETSTGLLLHWNRILERPTWLIPYFTLRRDRGILGYS